MGIKNNTREIVVVVNLTVIVNFANRVFTMCFKLLMVLSRGTGIKNNTHMATMVNLLFNGHSRGAGIKNNREGRLKPLRTF